MSNQIGSAVAARRDPERRDIALDVAGAGLMLRGRFGDWESGLTIGPDLDKVGVRLAVDATSAAAGAGEGDPLFAFHSRSVEVTGAGVFLARGTFTRPDFTKPVELTIETPPGHSALFVLTFAADKSDFGEGWPDLVENVIPFASREDGAPVPQAHAWLTKPVLAAA